MSVSPSSGNDELSFLSVSELKEVGHALALKKTQMQEEFRRLLLPAFVNLHHLASPGTPSTVHDDGDNADLVVDWQPHSAPSFLPRSKTPDEWATTDEDEPEEEVDQSCTAPSKRRRVIPEPTKPPTEETQPPLEE